MKLVKTFLRNLLMKEKLSNIDLLSIERVRAEKIYLDGFVDEFDIRRDDRRITLRCVDVDMKF